MDEEDEYQDEDPGERLFGKAGPYIKPYPMQMQTHLAQVSQPSLLYDKVGVHQLSLRVLKYRIRSKEFEDGLYRII